MSSKVIKTLQEGTVQECEKHLKNDILSAIKKFNLKVSGTKAQLCERLAQYLQTKSSEPAYQDEVKFSQDEVKVSKTPVSKTPVSKTPAKVASPKKEVHVCESFKVAELKDFLRKLNHPGMSKLTRKAQLCEVLDAYVAEGKFSWSTLGEVEIAQKLVTMMDEKKAEDKILTIVEQEEKKEIFGEPDIAPRTHITPKIVSNTIKNYASLLEQFKFISKVKSRQPSCTSILNVDKTSYTYDNALRFLIQRTTQSHDYQSQQFLQCFVQDIFTQTENTLYTADPFPILLQNIKQFLKFKRFRDEGQYGTVFLTYGRKASGEALPSPFAITKLVKLDKKGKAVDKYVENLHELASGFALNNLRKLVPNFMYTYGGFYCDAIQNADYPMCSTTDADKLTLLSVNEMIVDGKDLDTVIALLNPTPDQCKKLLHDALVQIAHALYLAEKAYKFVHLDLHGGNVLFTLSDPRTVVCKTDKYDITLHGVVLTPHIIDYGTCVITHNGTIFKNMWLSSAESPDPKDVMIAVGSTDDYYYPSFDIFRYIHYFLCTVGLDKLDVIELRDKYLGMFATPAKNNATYKSKWDAYFTQNDPQRWALLGRKPEHAFGWVADRKIWTMDCGDWLSLLQ